MKKSVLLGKQDTLSQSPLWRKDLKLLDINALLLLNLFIFTKLLI